MKTDYSANLALFLLEKTGSIFSTWEGKMLAKDQRALFGKFIGKGLIVINGQEETICQCVSVCFGQDYDYRNFVEWKNL
ncbi:hypothetical protein [Photorhabdus caribbeanensis]|uniref:hypothetical protein n=1 Tax=Photorhabdus caribbeanensis TaxID=1004165 RepID=UPI001BD3E5C0|nr:hypothetical protein [Photorhabdus caribbeanensis]MBS9422255.1 hypothetical protein [Photorhabdus caribbeanensis]